MEQVSEPVVLFSDSQTLDGCDRFFLVGDRVLTQGKRELDPAEVAAISVPPDEILNSTSVRSFLAAARALEQRLGSS
jgi:hypothetical protein